jgi:hypothetical protein
MPHRLPAARVTLWHASPRETTFRVYFHADRSTYLASAYPGCGLSAIDQSTKRPAAPGTIARIRDAIDEAVTAALTYDQRRELAVQNAKRAFH